MAARYVSSRTIKHISNGTRAMIVEYVDRTTSWYRPEFAPADSVKTDFVNVVQENLHTFNPQTARVAMKESEHTSDADQRKHYTAFELDKNGTVLGVKHLVHQLK
ncbi:hypothetical protein MferCBS31731_002535 [Microsporum ferrugineum]